MADILICSVDERTTEQLRLHAERRGKSLEVYLREALENLAREEPLPSQDDAEPFGTWLVEISRPGVDLDFDAIRGRSEMPNSTPRSAGHTLSRNDD